MAVIWDEDMIREYASALHRTARRLTHNRTDAEDLVQETFAKALAASDRFEHGTNLNAWLHRIMINTYITARRRRRCTEILVGDDIADWHRAFARAASAEDLVMSRMIDADVVTAMRALPEKHRLTVYLADAEGLAYKQIAGIAGMPVGSVKSSLHRARCSLRAALTRRDYPVTGRRSASTAPRP